MVQFIAACVQLNAQDDIQANADVAEALVREAAGGGARFITLPENAFFMQEPGKGPPPSFDATVERFSGLARALKVWLLIGSIHPPAREGRTWNRSLLINDEGLLVAAYDKIHLFDVTLKNGEIYRESERIDAGSKAVLAKTKWGGLGMTVCYDLRFPHLYRALAQGGARFLSVPAAFTYTTGTGHWHTLLRARAIENGCFVFAPAQCGVHPGNRRTYGHSLIVDPWGAIIAEGTEDRTGIITAIIDTGKIDEARAMIPSLRHDRPFDLPRKA
jgi:predicted amidohydrolase